MDDDDLDNYLRMMAESRAAVLSPSPPLFVDGTGSSGVAAAIAADGLAGGGGAGNDSGRRGPRRCLALRGGRRQSRPPRLRVDEQARRGQGTARRPGHGGSSPRADRRECRRGPRRCPAVPDIGRRERLGPRRRGRGRGGGSRGRRGRRAGGRTCTLSSRGRADPAPARL